MDWYFAGRAVACGVVCLGDPAVLELVHRRGGSQIPKNYVLLQTKPIFRRECSSFKWLCSGYEAIGLNQLKSNNQCTQSNEYSTKSIPHGVIPLALYLTIRTWNMFALNSPGSHEQCFCIFEATDSDVL